MYVTSQVIDDRVYGESRLLTSSFLPLSSSAPPVSNIAMPSTTSIWPDTGPQRRMSIFRYRTMSRASSYILKRLMSDGMAFEMSKATRDCVRYLLPGLPLFLLALLPLGPAFRNHTAPFAHRPHTLQCHNSCLIYSNTPVWWWCLRTS